MRVLAILCLLVVLPGCSRTIYASLQTAQRNSCAAQQTAERERCVAAADTSYDGYQQQR